MTITRKDAVRIVASSLCFDQEPAPIKRLDQARLAATAIVAALDQAGMLVPLADAPETANGGPVVNGAAIDPAQAEFPL